MSLTSWSRSWFSAAVMFAGVTWAGNGFGQTERGVTAWPWRGPTGNGIAALTETPPTTWNESTGENVIWSVPVPGRGHASPIVYGDRVYLATAVASAETQLVIAYDWRTGTELWSAQCHQGGFAKTIYPTNTHASASIATDGEMVFAVFINRDALHVTALNAATGQRVWSKDLGPFQPQKYQFGSGSSPVLADGKLLIAADTESNPFLCALDPASGKEIWKTSRPAKISFSTPVVAELGGDVQVLLSGGEQVAGYDLETGRELWQVAAPWEITCGTMVWDSARKIVYASGGYPGQQTLAIQIGERPEVLWKNGVKCYEQSLIKVEDMLFGFAEGGILYCWDALRGTELWSQRLKGGESASPVLAGGNLYFVNERGTAWVIKPQRDKFELVAKNQLGTEAYASPAVVDNSLLMRVARGRGAERQEFLIRIKAKQ